MDSSAKAQRKREQGRLMEGHKRNEGNRECTPIDANELPERRALFYESERSKRMESAKYAKSRERETGMNTLELVPATQSTGGWRSRTGLTGGTTKFQISGSPP